MSDEILPATLTAKERKRFAECKEVIHDGLKSCWRVGEALIEIRDYRYYREDFASFEEFCQATYHIGKAYAHRLIEAVEVKQDISERSPQAAKLLTNEAQTRELANVPRGAQVKVLKQLAKAGEPVTAQAIKEKAESLLEQTTDSIGRKVSPIGDARQDVPSNPVDETGFKLTPTAAESWVKRDAVQSLLTAVSRAKNSFETIRDDPLFVFRHQEITQAFQTLYHLLSECKPYAVCPECEGYPEKQSGGECPYCRRSGIIAKAKYTELCNSKVASIREKAKRGRAQA